MIFKKLCSYCWRLTPETDMVLFRVGKYKEKRRMMCKECAKARKNPKGSSERFAQIVEESKRRYRTAPPPRKQKGEE